MENMLRDSSYMAAMIHGAAMITERLPIEKNKKLLGTSSVSSALAGPDPAVAAAEYEAKLMKESTLTALFCGEPLGFWTIKDYLKVLAAERPPPPSPTSRLTRAHVVSSEYEHHAQAAVRLLAGRARLPAQERGVAEAGADDGAKGGEGFVPQPEADGRALQADDMMPHPVDEATAASFGASRYVLRQLGLPCRPAE